MVRYKQIDINKMMLTQYQNNPIFKFIYKCLIFVLQIIPKNTQML